MLIFSTDYGFDFSEAIRDMAGYVFSILVSFEIENLDKDVFVDSIFDLKKERDSVFS